MQKYRALAQDIIDHVGGPENIIEVHHCVTRLRFGLKDQSVADEAYLKQLEGTKGIAKNKAEYQVIIGQHVHDVFEEVTDILGFAGDNVVPSGSGEEKQSIPAKIMATVFSALNPALGVLCASGLVKGILALLTLLGWINTEGGIYQLLNAASDAMFYFMPVVLAYNLSQKVKMDKFTAILIGAALCYPAIQGVDLKIFGLTINATYTQTFLPVILIVWLFAPLDRKLREWLPESIRSFLAPAIILCLAVPIGFCLIGPVANWISDLIAKGLDALFGFSPIIAGVILGAIWTPLILFGFSSAVGMISWVPMLNGVPSKILGITTLTCFMSTAALLALFIKSRHDNKLRGDCVSTGISTVFGITEPCLYGVVVPRPRLFVLICIGNAILGAACSIFGVMQYTWAGFGVSGILGLLNPDGSNLPGILISLAIGFVATFILVLLFYREKKPAEAAEK